MNLARIIPNLAAGWQMNSLLSQLDLNLGAIGACPETLAANALVHHNVYDIPPDLIEDRS